MSSPKLSNIYYKQFLKSKEFKKKCEDTKKDYENNQKKQKQLKKVLDICKKESFKYGKKELKLYELLKIIKSENKKDVSDFLDLFPPPTMGKTTNSHVFEALWIIIFALKFDDLYDKHYKRIIYTSIENKEIDLDYKTKSIKNFLKKNVNVSRQGGIVDLYFEDILTTPKEELKLENGFPCQNKCDHDNLKKIKSKKSYLYSSKFFKNDTKKGISSLDIEKIFTEAIEEYDKNIEDFNIGIFVKDKSVIFDKAAKSRKKAARLLNREISYGLGDLNIYYKRLLNYLKNIDLSSNNPFNEILPHKSKLIPMFHQNMFIDLTKNEIDNNNFKFIWGAVPRSGKSFIIGGLIEKLNKNKQKYKNILIILGAVSETHSQFEDMFTKYSGSFPDTEYKIINIKKKKQK